MLPERESLTSAQSVLIWLFTVTSGLFGILSATSYVSGPSEINLLVFPLTLLNIPVSLGALLCGWYLVTHGQARLALATFSAGGWGLFASWLFLTQI